MRYDIIAFVLIGFISLVSAGVASFLFFKNRRMVKTIIELHIQRGALEDLISLHAAKQDSPSEQGDGFIKFLSDSREWAFNYIDNVQSTILVLKEKYDNKKAIDESLKQLFEMLPDNNNKEK
jgi:hypothetical protein